MKSVALSASTRTLSRRGGVKKVRAAGRIPAVIYGHGRKPENLEVGVKDLENAIHAAHSEILMVDLAVQGASGARLALVRDVQHHPLTGKFLHVDFQEVSADEKITVSIPVETTGEASGVKNGGGTLEHVLFKIKVRATAKDLPEVITVDVTNLEVGKSIHLGELTPPPGVEFLGHKEVPVVAVAAPLTEAQEAAADAAAGVTAGQPEMIKEKKEEGAEAGKAAAPAKAGDKAAGDKAAEKKPAEKKK